MKNYWVQFWAHPLLVILFLLPLHRVSTPRNSSGKRPRPGLDHGTFFGARYFCRECSHKILVMKYPCLSTAQYFFAENCSCAVSMCIWTARARTKCGKFCLGLFFPWQVQLFEDLGKTFSDVHESPGTLSGARHFPKIFFGQTCLCAMSMHITRHRLAQRIRLGSATRRRGATFFPISRVE